MLLGGPDHPDDGPGALRIKALLVASVTVGINSDAEPGQLIEKRGEDVGGVLAEEDHGVAATQRALSMVGPWPKISPSFSSPIGRRRPVSLPAPHGGDR
jgi:hypothetical protein